ncbi:MAG: hypothetical protein LBP68_03465 [Acidobacteriota bacterium]|jgi:transcriptional regulator with XRE-family HTH domain|nr:hypothetical protein [Acidobacteriota bacterium]
MKCLECGESAVEKTSTLENPYPYKESGLANVFLVGVRVTSCACGEESVLIPKIGQLNDLIARNLVEKKGLLDGRELKYLRKYAGFPANKFAALLTIDPAYLSRVENGKVKNLGGTADKLARALVAAARDKEYMKNVLLAVDENRIDVEQSKARPIFQLVSNRWKAA